MRLFFGLKPDPQTCLDIDAWRQRTLPPLDHPVAPQNLHVTLAFLGEVDARKLEPLTDEVDVMNAREFTLQLDQLGYFPKPRVLWIGPQQTPDSAVALARDLQRICRRLQLRTERRQFTAHLTIARRCNTPPPASTEPPSFEVAFSSFSLFESVNIRSGVQYQLIHDWPLTH